MPGRRGLGSGVHVESDFVEADLDTAYALLYVAETQSLAGDCGSALRALEDAEKAIADGDRRLARLSDSDRDRLRGQVERMRGVVEAVRLTLK